MRRSHSFLILAGAALACGGCEIISHGDELPTAAQQADADYNNPFSDFNRPLDDRGMHR